MKNRLNKIEMAQIIIMELYAYKQCPAKDDPKVIKRARLSSEVLNGQVEMAIRSKVSRDALRR